MVQPQSTTPSASAEPTPTSASSKPHPLQNFTKGMARFLKFSGGLLHNSTVLLGKRMRRLGIVLHKDFEDFGSLMRNAFSM